MKTTRVQLDLGPDTMMLLKILKEKTEATTYAEVIRWALRLYWVTVVDKDPQS